MKYLAASFTTRLRTVSPELTRVAFCFGAIMEGAAGFGAPAAIAGESA